MHRFRRYSGSPAAAVAMLSVALGCLAVLVRANPIGIQQCTPATCHNEAINVNVPQLEELLEHAGPCTASGLLENNSLTDGAFSKYGTILKQGARGSLTGECVVRGCSGSTCVTFFSQDRTILSVPLSYYDPLGQPPASNYLLVNKAPNGATIYLQNIDSSIVGTTNPPVNRKPMIEGTWDFRAWVLSSQTNCAIMPTIHEEKHVEVNVLSCKPNWWTTGTPDLDEVNLHPANGPITIAVPPGFEDAIVPLQGAVQGWESLGKTINVVPSSICQPGDGRCVTFDETYGGSGCAVILPAPHDPNGEWGGAPVINLRPRWRTSHPDHLTRRFSHELGHYVGLHHRDDSSCSCSSTTMGPALSSNCDDPAPPANTTCTLVPTPSDVFALKQSTYGKQNRKICGWPL